jgi:hypothetical protein
VLLVITRGAVEEAQKHKLELPLAVLAGAAHQETVPLVLLVLQTLAAVEAVGLAALVIVEIT